MDMQEESSIRLAARRLVAYSEELERKYNQYLDDVEEYGVVERLARHGWQLADYAVTFDPGEFDYGRWWAVETIPDEELDEGQMPSDWEDVVMEFDGDYDQVDAGPKVLYKCDEYGPTGFRIIGHSDADDVEECFG